MRNDNLKRDKTAFGIIDAKSIKNADTAQEKGYDAGKKVSGIKLHIVVGDRINLSVFSIFQRNSRIHI